MTGPAGAGKTTVVAEWARGRARRGSRVHWVDLHDVASAPPPAGALVILDGVDRQRVDHRSAVRAAIDAHRSGVCEAVVVVSRSDAARLSEARFLDVLTAQITADDLRLTEPELPEVFADRKLSPSEWALVARLSGGWRVYAARAVELLVARAGGLERELCDEFDRGVLDGLPAIPDPVRRLLVCADSWDSELVQVALADTTPTQARDLLLAAEELGVMWRTAGGSGAYQVVSPPAAALRRAARHDESGRDEYLAAARAVSALLADRNRLTEALEVALASDDPALVRVIAMAVGEHARFDLLRRVAEGLSGRPREWFAGDEQLFVASMLGDRGGKLPYSEWLQSVEPVQWDGGDENGLREALLTYSTTIVLHRVRGDLPRSVAHAHRAMQVSKSLRSSRSPRDGTMTVALDSAAVSLFLAGEYRSATAAVTDAIDVAQRLDDPRAINVCLSHLAAIHALRGDITAATEALGQLRDHVDLEGFSPHMSALEHVARGIVALERGSVHEAQAELHRSREIGDQAEHWWLIDLLAAGVRAHADDMGAAEHIERVVVDAASHGRIISAPDLYAALRMRLALLRGLPASVLTMTQRRQWESAPCRVPTAAAHLVLANPRAALRIAEPQTQSASYWDAGLARLICAVAGARLDRSEVARAYAADGVGLLASVGLQSVVRYLTLDSQAVIADHLDEGLAEVFGEWCARHSHASTPDVLLPVLSTRERQILHELRGDRELAEIADALGVSRNTVKTLTTRLYRKLGVKSRREAVELATRARAL